MTNSIKIYVVDHYYPSYAKFYGTKDVKSEAHYANWIKPHTVTNDIAEADLVLFTGGEDISPSLYYQRPHKRTSFSKDRDKYERDMFDQALALGKTMLGICRGGQLLHTLNGGQMIQHVSNHGTRHEVWSPEGKEMVVSSMHHQMMELNPEIMDRVDILLVSCGVSTCYEGEVTGKDIESAPFHKNQEPEALMYKDTKCICIQGHPEAMDNKDSELHQYLRKIIYTTIYNLPF
jgi:gamma-glutamyl-gamma-aminobutyrate hydrolase PuuD